MKKNRDELTYQDVHMHHVHFAVITPLPEEWHAVKAKLEESQEYPFVYPTFTGRLGQFRIAVIMPPVTGGYAASDLTRLVVERLRPRWVALVGVAGGFVAEGVQLGDVVFASYVYAYEYGKIEKGSFQRRETYDFSPDLRWLARAKMLEHAPTSEQLEWKRRILAKRPDKRQRRQTKLHVGNIGSGEKVIDDPEYKFFVDALFNHAVPSQYKLKAIEMEGAGSGASVSSLQTEFHVGFLMIRGISDLPPRGTQERDSWKPYAAAAAATFLEHLLSGSGTAAIPIGEPTLLSSLPRSGTPDLPRGTVTFLFTDIEGSTEQWERDPATTRVVVDRQLAIIQHAVEMHGGIHFKTVGDGTQSAFFTAPQGVAAALDAQRGLVKETWPNLSDRPRVRMALHAGAAEPSDGDYLAGCLNRLARLLESAHGEQILLSLTMAELASDGLPKDASLEALGTFRLRDILQPEEIFQLRHPDLRANFPPLKSPGQLPHNLPVHPTPFLGRVREVEEAVTLLLLPSVRLLTLTGTGGVGKTRLGFQVAAEALESFPDGAFLIDLARLNDPALIPTATATTLGLQEQQGKPLLETLADYLRDRQILLLFDNFEHLLPAATFLADLLVAAPSLKVMVTSRARLGLLAEHEYQVETLPVPNHRALPSLEELATYDAIDLFVKRAQARRPNFSLTEKNAKAVAEIVCRLEGLPLAIELAAAWVKMLSPDALRDRLDRRLTTLVGGARDLPARQQTLRDTIAWSHDLLSPQEQALFRRLSVFVGGWSLDGAAAVASIDGDIIAIDAVEILSRLIDQSLVETRQASDEAELRYIMLETIREFAGEKLDASSETTHVRAAFERFLIDLAAKAEDGMRGSEQIHWLDKLKEEHNNIRAALRNAVDRGDGDVALNLAPTLWEFWRIRGYLVEGSAWLKRALDLAPANAPELRAAGEFALGKLSIDLANYEAAETHFRNSANLWQARGDQQRVVDAKNALMIVKLNTEEFEEGRALGEEALRIAGLIGDELGSATALFNLGLIARSDGRLNEAVELLDEALTLWRAKGNPKWIALTTQSLGITHRRLGHLDRARAYLEESREICKRLNNLYGLAIVASELGLIEEEIGHHDRAIDFHLEAMKGFETVGAPLGIIESLEWIGVSAANTGLAIPALQLFGAAAAARRTLRATPMSSEAPFINAGLETARQRANARAEDALRSGARLTLEQAHKLALSLAAEPVLKREGDPGRSLP